MQKVEDMKPEEFGKKMEHITHNIIKTIEYNLDKQFVKDEHLSIIYTLITELVSRIIVATAVGANQPVEIAANHFMNLIKIASQDHIKRFNECRAH